MDMRFFAAAGLAALTAAASAAEAPLELLKESSFRPVYLRGGVTAARGWGMHDEARVHSIREERVYVSGEDCFTLSAADGVFSIVFKSPLHPIYRTRRSITLASRNGDAVELLPPADHYTFKCRVKFKNGGLGPAGGKAFPESDGWQDISLTLKKPTRTFVLSPREGAEYHFSEAHLYAEYPEIGGFIALPEGGRLEKILIPENASFETRLGLGLWRGWLWKLTGVALPIETVKRVDAPVRGALVAVKGPEEPGRWSLKIDRDGAVVSYGTELEIVNSVFDYLRRGLGCAFYQNDCVKIPEMGSVKVLPGIDFTAAPRYNYFNSCSALCARQGGAANTLLYTRNDVDYYHLPTSKCDHVFNVLLPQERYFGPHPEYFAADGRGHRRVRENPHYTMHCLSNPEVLEKVLESAVEYAKAQYGPQRLVIDEGDAKEHCLCPECVKFNRGRTSCSNTVYRYHRRLAERIAEVRPDLIVERHSYASRTEPPDDAAPLPPNSRLVYCMGAFRCKLHVECEANREALELVTRLRRQLVGDDPRRMSFMHYSDLRPLYMVKQMSTLRKYGSDVYFLWHYKSFHPAIPFLLGRWNLGEDPEKLLREFEEAYYGKGAPFVHQVFVLVEKFAEDYRHSPEELKLKKRCSIWPDNFGGSETVLDRPTLDRVHALFRKALKAACRDKAARRHICRDWLFFLTEDLNKFRPASCRTDADLKAYARRLAAVVRMGEEFPGAFDTIMHQTEAREFLTVVTGVTIPRTRKNWAGEPMLRAIVREPEKHLSRHGESFLGHGTYFKPAFFRSSFETTEETRPAVGFSERRRDHMLLRPQQEMSLAFTLRKFGGRPLALGIEGAVQRRDAEYPIAIEVNGKRVYDGNAVFAADRWSRMGFSIPPEFLAAGDNLLTIRNLSPDAGWLAISEIYTIDVSADFRDFAAGNPSMWRPLRENGGPVGTARGGDGKMVLTAPPGGAQVQAFFANRHDFPKIAAFPGGKAELTVRAAGRGKLRLAIIRYSPYELDEKGVQLVKPVGYTRHVGGLGVRRSRTFELSPEPREYRHVFDTPPEVGMVIPEIVVPEGRAEITDFSLRVIPATGTIL